MGFLHSLRSVEMTGGKGAIGRNDTGEREDGKRGKDTAFVRIRWGRIQTIKDKWLRDGRAGSIILLAGAGQTHPGKATKKPRAH